RLDPVRQRLVIAAVVPGAAREAAGELGEEGLVADLAAAERHEAAVAAGEERRQDVEREIETLLLGEAGDDAEHRRVGLRHSDLAQEHTLHLSLAGEVAERVVVRNARIGLRIPLSVVDAVDDPLEM